MGRLRTIELENFKSYAGQQVIGPFDDFTCIIGPNGSGKSNMMDAISFVLGIQSRHLRSSHLKELIYRRDADSAPARRASVKLVYGISDDDDIEGFRAGTDLVFQRSISSAGVSSYKLNNRDVTYEVYESTLQKIGVLVKARNFLVFQGDVESVASKSPQDLTKLLEQICGSDLLKEEYEELQKKKDEAEESTIFSMQKKKMYSTQRKEIKEQKDEAELFQQKQEELEELKTELTLWQIWKVKQAIDEHEAAAAATLEKLEANKAEEEELESEMQKGKKELARVGKLLSAAEKDQAAHTKKMGNEILPKLTEVRAKLKSLKKRLSEIEKMEANMQQDKDNQEENVAALQREIKTLVRNEEALLREMEAAEAGGPKMDARKAEEYARLREECAARTATQQADLTALEAELKSKQQRVQRLRTQEAALKAESELGDNLLKEYSDRADRMRIATADGKKDMDRLTSERDHTIVEMRRCQERAQELTAELEEVTQKVRDAGDDKRRGKQEERINEAIEAMQRIFTGVHSKLVDLCRPIQKKYAQAIATCGGKNMDAIIVDNKQVAADCIRYLKDQRVGTCSFLPLDNISAKPPPERLRTLAPTYRLCVDLVECEDLFKPAVAYALGAALVCDTLDEARDLCFKKGEKVKCVTLRGEVISKNGSMTGGVGGGTGSDRWEEKEIEKLRKKKTECEEALARNKSQMPTRQQLVDLETQVKTLQTRVQFSEADLKVTEEKLRQLRQQKDLKEKAVKDLGKEIDALNKDAASVEKRFNTLQRQVREIESAVFASFSASVGVTNIREFEESRLKQHQKAVADRAAIAEQKAALEAQLEYELKRDFAGNIQRLHAQRAEASKQISSLEEKEAELIAKDSEVRAALNAAAEKIKSLKGEVGEANAQVKDMQIQRTAIVGGGASLAKKLSGEEILIERARAQLHEILQKAMVDEIALPTVSQRGGDEGLAWNGSQIGSGKKKRASKETEEEESEEGSEATTTTASSRSRGAVTGSRASSTTGTSVSAHFSQPENPVVQRDAKTMAMVDLSSMQGKARLSKQQQQDEQNSIMKQIAALTNELESMQPNMHAAERYEGVLDKLKECNTGLEDAKELSREVSTKFEEVKTSRQVKFQDCYNHVSEALGKIYRELTMSSKHPMGGNAYLTLENNDEPYLGGIRFTAMPPMKRFRDMEQLSGGEKTMAALALLFAIHSYRQAPFFVLDEVDAALDNVNVKKVCNYVMQQSKRFQCVVISLKDMFFEHADSLIGVCKDVDTLSSQVLTLDLKKYDQNALGGEGVGAVSRVAALPSPSTSASHSQTATPTSSMRGSGGMGRKTVGGSGGEMKKRVRGQGYSLREIPEEEGEGEDEKESERRQLEREGEEEEEEEAGEEEGVEERKGTPKGRGGRGVKAKRG